jgi:L-alanine-DL-glutamate epimerase-like enolase superfamily enzyme
MKITRIDTIPINVPIHADKVTVGARGTHATSPFLIVQVHTDEGITGLGEVSCTPGWSGEDQVSATHFIRTLLAPALVGKYPCTITVHGAAMNRLLANNPFTKAGIEMALWDIVGKASGQPVSMLLGGPVRDSVRTKYSVSGLEPAKAAAIASWAAEQGFTAMKVKVGMDPDTDLLRVREVRNAVGPNVFLGVDANGGWSPSTAVRLLPHLEALDIAFVEQPVPPGDPRWLARVRAAATMPIVADESVSNSHDALSLIANDAADVFSIYVGMGGGIREGAAIATIAGAAALTCTIGSNLELGIAQAAMIHLAISQPAIRPEVIPCDILSAFFYEGDIVAEPLPVQAGVAHPIDKPGLGVDLDMEAVRRYRVT